MRDCRADEPERAFHEHIECLIPYLIRRLVKRPGIEQVTCIVYEDVETAKRADRPIDRFLYIRFTRHASLKRQRMAAPVLNVFHNPLQFLFPPSRDRDLRALPRKGSRNRFPMPVPPPVTMATLLLSLIGAPSYLVVYLRHDAGSLSIPIHQIKKGFTHRNLLRFHRMNLGLEFSDS